MIDKSVNDADWQAFTSGNILFRQNSENKRF